MQPKNGKLERQVSMEGGHQSQSKTIALQETW